MINTKILKQRIEESGYRFSWIAKQLNLSPYGLRKKVNGENDFKISEVNKICKLLNITDKGRNSIFFLQNLNT